LERVCFTLQVRPDRLDEYKERHRAVWPEMLAALSATGWHNYSLYLRPCGQLIGYFETPDFDRALAEMSKLEVNGRWQREMAPFFVSMESEGRPDKSFIRLEEVFHLD